MKFEGENVSLSHFLHSCDLSINGFGVRPRLSTGFLSSTLFMISLHNSALQFFEQVQGNLLSLEQLHLLNSLLEYSYLAMYLVNFSLFSTNLSSFLADISSWFTHMAVERGVG